MEAPTGSNWENGEGPIYPFGEEPPSPDVCPMTPNEEILEVMLTR